MLLPNCVGKTTPARHPSESQALPIVNFQLSAMEPEAMFKLQADKKIKLPFPTYITLRLSLPERQQNQYGQNYRCE
jgi:hypothetical protein